MPPSTGAGNVPPVRIKYEAIDAVSAPLAKMAAAQTSLLSTAANLSLVMQGVGMAFRAAQTVMSSTIRLNQEYEQSILTIAGNLSAFDLAPNFENAKKQAVDLFGTIQKLAAALPGETEQYVQVFKTVLPQAIDAFAAQGGASLEQMAEFTSKWTAVTVTQGIDAAQAARDLRQMLSGRAGMDVRSFSEMAGFLRRSAKELGIQGDLNAKTFNAFDQSTRLKILQGTIKQFDPLLGNFSNTADALQGTVTSIAKELGRAATLPLFEVYKEGLIRASEWATKHKDRLMEIGKAWGTAVAGGIRVAATAMGQLMSTAQRLLPIAQRIGAGIGTAAGKLSGLYNQQVKPHTGSAGLALGAGAGAFGQLVSIVAALNPLLTIAATALQSLATNSGFLSAVMQGVRDIVATVIPIFRPFVEVLRTAGAMLGQLVATILPPLLRLFGEFLKPLSLLAQLVLPAVKDAMQRLTPLLGSIAVNVIKFAEGLVKFMSPLTTTLAVFGGLFVDILLNVVIPAFLAVAEVLAILAGNVGGVLALNDARAETAKIIAGIQSARGATMGGNLVVSGAYGALTTAVDNGIARGMSAFQTFASSTLPEAYARAVAAPGAAVSTALDALRAQGDKHPSKTAKTVQDFRGSHFTITQQFAEGFDPDRIAAIFGQDVARLGEIRRQSSLAPLYSVR